MSVQIKLSYLMPRSEILKCEQCFLVVLSVYYAVQGGSNF